MYRAIYTRVSTEYPASSTILSKGYGVANHVLMHLIFALSMECNGRITMNTHPHPLFIEGRKHMFPLFQEGRKRIFPLFQEGIKGRYVSPLIRGDKGVCNQCIFETKFLE